MFAETAIVVTTFILRQSHGISEVGYIADVKQKFPEYEGKMILIIVMIIITIIIFMIIIIIVMIIIINIIILTYYFR